MVGLTRNIFSVTANVHVSDGQPATRYAVCQGFLLTDWPAALQTETAAALGGRSGLAFVAVILRNK